MVTKKSDFFGQKKENLNFPSEILTQIVHVIMQRNFEIDYGIEKNISILEHGIFA